MGGGAVALRGVGAREGGGILARRSHAAPLRRQTPAVGEDNNVQCPAGVYLLQGGVSDEGRKVGLRLGAGAVGACGGRLGVKVRGVRWLRDIKEAQALNVTLRKVC